ncbi:CDP-glycerol glycerophosphotransferase family protein [Nocardioides mangrovi]|uniref:CDP-glycerol glycerophosphotransferase family protein n=1 Tax=Nocardioides mangrovi TaxID=2874580 RepID=A0ABS7UA10_9ACTN|nr:CDP-glycerol glycerophosphotransferase family protein [Nocardioides mangrovi]MBZ5737657.1 CDP-glycerol glycerophosphotransferase family protein [Nocardioides mangrovi]
MRVLRNLALDLVLVSLRVGLRLLSRVVPTSRSVVLSASPETEGNGVEVARALLGRYTGTIVWLRDGGPVPVEVEALADRGMVLVPKASPAGLWAYLRAEAVLFTHGLYGSPRPVPRKPVVNLFHGDGPKDVRPARGVGAPMASTYLVGSTTLFSGFQAEAFDVPRDRLLLTGNPRTDQLWRDLTPHQLAALGITGPYVVWLPTFRQPRAVGAVRVHDAAVVRDDAAAGLAGLLAGLADRGLQLVVKPHPMDADRRRTPGVVTIDDDDLARVGVGLYPLLGSSAGLVTDYSSAWVDYLLVDRPIAFLVPDRSTYDRELLPADVLDWAPGEVVDNDPWTQPFAEFFADLDTHGRRGSSLRLSVAERIGLNPTTTAADDLVTELVKRGVLDSA